MNVAVVGTGYVGLVTGSCFSEFGVQVVCVDKDEDKIASLRQGEMPIYEPGLEDLVGRNVREGRLSFSSETSEAIRNALVVFVAVGTPAAANGSTDLSYVEAVAREVGQCIDSYKVIITKSTVPVGTAKKVRKWVQEELDAKGSQVRFSVASNPEFLREGAAIADFMRPDRVVIGTDEGDEQALAIIQDLYRPLFLNETPFVISNVATAELSKYAANAFLATKISFINEISILCERIGGDVQGVARAMGLDKRIGSKFLHAGPGFGGSCFPKDTLSAAHFAREVGVEFEIVEAAIRANARQREHVTQTVRSALEGDVAGKTITLLGLSFKPETDDVRDSPAIDIARKLLEEGATVRAFDPQAMVGAGECLPGLVLCKDVYEACEGGDVLVIATEWNQFRMLDLARAKSLLNEPIMVDLRNIYHEDVLRAEGFNYVSVGR